MSTRKFAIPFAATLLGGTMLAATPVLAQSQDWSGDRGGSRDWMQSRDRMDPYDRYLQRMERDRQGQGYGQSGGYGSRDMGGRDMGSQGMGGQRSGRSGQRQDGGYGGSDSDRSDMAERYGRAQFERGYRAGREDERRRRSSQYSGGSDGGSRSSSASGGRGTSADYYWVVPDILPDTQRYSGMQDFALVPTTRARWIGCSPRRRASARPSSPRRRACRRVRAATRRSACCRTR
jgi:hypothetical protein